MPMFRKKPVVIEARQFTDSPENTAQLIAWIGDNARAEHDGAENGMIVIATLEGEMTASPGDWIIRGVNGEFYPCKPDIFAKTYEVVSTLAPHAFDPNPSLGTLAKLARAMGCESEEHFVGLAMKAGGGRFNPSALAAAFREVAQ